MTNGRNASGHEPDPEAGQPLHEARGGDDRRRRRPGRSSPGHGSTPMIDLGGPSARNRPMPGGFAMKHKNVYRTELTPVSFLERSAYVFPDKVAVIHGARRYTYRAARGAGEPAGVRAARAPAWASTTAWPSSARTSPPCSRRTSACPPPAASSSPSTPACPPTRSATSSSTPARRFLFVDAELEPLVEAARSVRRSAWSGSTTPAPPAIPTRTSSPPGSPAPVRELARGRGGDDRHQLHLRAPPGGPKGVMYTPPRRLPQRPRRGARDGHELRQRLPLDAAHVPLQRLVLHLGRDRGRRHPRLPAQGRTRRASGS